MGNYLFYFILQRLWEICLCLCIAIRPSPISLMYTFFLFLSPYLNLNFKGRKIYYCAVFLLSSLIIISQILFQINQLWEFYVFNEIYLDIFYEIGFIDYKSMRIMEVLKRSLPDIAILISVPIFYSVFKNFTATRQSESDSLKKVTVHADNVNELRRRSTKFNFYLNTMKKIGLILSLCAELLSGSICPSIVNGIFFISFLIISIWLGINRKLGCKFAWIIRALSCLKILKINALILYQMSFVQYLLPLKSMPAKLLGLHLLKSSKQDEMELLILIIAYLIVVCTSNLILQLEKSISDEDKQAAIIQKRTSYESIKTLTLNCIYEWSYILTIFSMMVLSILYHSWMNFIFLIVSNVMWILPNQRKKVIKISPFIVLYAVSLIALDYFYDMKSENYPIIHIVIKSTLSLPFFMTMRQRFSKTYSSSISRVSFIVKSKFHLFIIETLMKIAIFSWMWFIAFALLILALYESSEMTLFRIANMSFFIIYVLLYQLSFDSWKKSLYIFWIMLIGYAKLSLITIYVFQFDNNTFKLSFINEEAIGLRKFETSELFIKLFSFTMINIFTGIQLNYFHSHFMNYAKAAKYDERNQDDENERNRLMYKCQKIIEKSLLFIDIHFYKIYFVIVFYILTNHIQIINILAMLILIIGVVCHSRMYKAIIVKIITVLSSVFIFGIMLFEFSKLFDYDLNMKLDSQCALNETSIYKFEVRSIEEWFQINDDFKLWQNIKICYGFITASTIFFIITRIHSENGKRSILMFENITKRNVEKSIVNLIKYLFNHAFYHIGTELTLIVFIIVILGRMDLISILYIPVFLIFVFKSRQGLSFKIFWTLMMNFIAASICLQCISIGFMVIMKPCFSEKIINHEDYNNICIRIFHYSYYSLCESPWIINYDFLLLSVMHCQFDIFKTKESDKTKVEDDDEPIEDSNGIISSLKKFIFKVQFWVTISLIFFAGTQNVEIFGLGYITASFIFLWQGTDFYLKPINEIKNWWTSMLAFNLMTLAIKITAKIGTCFFKGDSNACGNLKFESSYYIWDLIVFVFIIIQWKIFSSEYFQNTVIDTFITTLLSSRGAQMIEEIRILDMKEAAWEEKVNLHNIKKKMEMIRKFASMKMAKNQNPLNHDLAIRSGDYFMFKDDLFEEMELLPHDYSSVANVSRQSEIKSEIEMDINSEKSKEKIKIVGEKTRHFKETCAKLMNKILYKLHSLSKDRTLIAKVLEEEKRYLRRQISLNSSSSQDLHERFNHEVEKNRLLSTLNKFDVEKWKEELVVNYGMKSEHNTTNEIIRELFYFGLTHTSLIVYITIFINQTFSSNILSMTLPLSIFMLGTLTFPRPSKSFWIILIAYTQIIIFVKCLAQFDVIWWDKNHSFIKLLGLESKENFATFDLLLLLALFFHRTVLKMFGIWKTDVQYEFSQGSYELHKRDANTKSLVKYLLTKRNFNEKVNHHSFFNAHMNESENQLITEETDSKILFRHEYNKRDSSVRQITKNRYELIKAKEKLFRNNDGKLSVMLTQDDVQLNLHPIDLKNSRKLISIEKLVLVEHTIEEPWEFFPSIVVLSLKQYASLMTQFIKELIPKQPRKPVDVYTYMFLCGFVNFLVLLFGFSRFAIHVSQDDSRSIINYIEENKVPSSLLLLLIVQFMIIIIDRVLYVRKNMQGKIIFHYFIIISTHIWLFFTLPFVTKQNFNSTLPPVLFYAICCIYMLLSAYQIRSGYPARILGNFLMKKYDLIHMLCFKVFMIVPFLFELRSLIDWTFTPTCLTFAEWLRVDTIYAQVFVIKCKREAFKHTPRGVQKSWLIKMFFGAGMITVIILILWLPMIFFAFTHSLGQNSAPGKFSIEIRIASYEPLYKINVGYDSMHQFTAEDLNLFKILYEKYPRSIAYLDDFEKNDIVVLQFNVNSSTTWNVSPPNLEHLIEDLNSEIINTISFTYEISQIGYLKDKDASRKFDYRLSLENRKKLLKILRGDYNTTLSVESILPKFLYVANTGKVNLIPELFIVQNQKPLRDIGLKMFSNENSSWWNAQEICNDSDIFYQKISKNFPNDCEKYLNIYIFNEKSFPSQLSSFAVKGIFGLYVTVIVVASRFIRNILINFGNLSIISDELPNVDKILNLCKNIYMVREAQEFILEEDLVAKLIFLYRSPETLIKYTRHKEA